jgi:outer membrane receptor for ferrienterochelin and colicins
MNNIYLPIRISIFLLFFISITTIAGNNTIAGRIIDSLDNKGISGARINLLNQDKVFLSRDDGSFIISNINKYKYTLEIASLGYQSKTIEIDARRTTDSILTIILQPVIEDMETVVVTGTRSEKRLKDVPVQTQVIYTSRLKTIGITSVGAALEHEVPGLDFAQFSYRPKVAFQGMNAKYVLFLIDGERIAGEMDGDIDYSRLNLDNVERIEVVRGASSVLYGSNAIGGVVNIITKKQELPFDINARVRYSDYNELSSGTSVGFRTGDFSSVSNVVYNQTDGYDLTPTTESPDFTQEKFKNISINQRFDFNINKKIFLTSSGDGFYNRIYDGHSVPADHAYAGFRGLIKAVYAFSDSSNFEISYAADKYLNYMVYTLNKNKHEQTAYDFIQSLKATVHLKYRKGMLILGSEYLPEQVESIRITDTSKSADEIIGFVQNDYNISKNYSVLAGIRATKQSIYGMNIVPKVSLMAKYDLLTLRLSYGWGFRSPSLKDMYYDFYHMGFLLLGNKNLKPEKSNYTGLSIDINQSRFHHSISLFHNSIKDLITGVWIVPQEVNQYQNVSSARIIGIDFMEKISILRNLTLNAGISLASAKNTETGYAIKDINPLSGNLSLTYFTDFLKYKTNFELYGKFNGHRSYEPIGDITYEDPAYSLWRINVSQQFNSFTYTIGIDNIFKNVDQNSLGNISPGRRYFISVNFSFSKY